MKEVIEVFSNGKILKLENFNSLTGYGFKKFKKMSSFKQDKGQNNCIDEFFKSIITGNEAISINEIIEIADKTLESVGD